MEHKIDENLLTIVQEIKDLSKSTSEWREIESDDQFQMGNYTGGFDATEDAFTFSYHPDNAEEIWIQFSLDEVDKILNQEIAALPSRYAQ